MPRFSCKHRSSKSPEDLTSNDGTFACLCRHCHLTADKHRSRKLHRALMVKLGELNTMIDLVQNNRLDPATITLELHRLHAQRKEAKDQYRLDLRELWKEYEKRWRIWYIPHEYWI
ncbi:hypothetical protein GB937_005967 [Aspergillus fischeri]|nr:hypothetical protein GB937_005967 [Aspergillus fischeri]